MRGIMFLCLRSRVAALLIGNIGDDKAENLSLILPLITPHFVTTLSNFPFRKAFYNPKAYTYRTLLTSHRRTGWGRKDYLRGLD